MRRRAQPINRRRRSCTIPDVAPRFMNSLPLGFNPNNYLPHYYGLGSYLLSILLGSFLKTRHPKFRSDMGVEKSTNWIRVREHFIKVERRHQRRLVHFGVAWKAARIVVWSRNVNWWLYRAPATALLDSPQVPYLQAAPSGGRMSPPQLGQVFL